MKTFWINGGARKCVTISGADDLLPPMYQGRKYLGWNVESLISGGGKHFAQGGRIIIDKIDADNIYLRSIAKDYSTLVEGKLTSWRANVDGASEIHFFKNADDTLFLMKFDNNPNFWVLAQHYRTDDPHAPTKPDQIIYPRASPTAASSLAPLDGGNGKYIQTQDDEGGGYVP